MKICVTASEPRLEANVDPRFGRCAYFAFVDTESAAVDWVKNVAVEQAHGAGVSAAQCVVDAGATAVYSGKVGPNAAVVFEKASIAMIAVSEMTVAGAIALAKKSAG